MYYYRFKWYVDKTLYSKRVAWLFSREISNSKVFTTFICILYDDSFTLWWRWYGIKKCAKLTKSLNRYILISIYRPFYSVLLQFLALLESAMDWTEKVYSILIIKVCPPKTDKEIGRGIEFNKYIVNMRFIFQLSKWKIFYASHWRQYICKSTL